MSEMEPTEAYPVWIDMRVRTEGLAQVIYDLGTPLNEEPPGEDDDLNALFMAWGFGTNWRQGEPLPASIAIGCYGDWFWLEDLVVLMPAIAPFVENYHELVYSLDRYFGQRRDTCYRWYFEDGEVQHFKGQLEWEFAWGRHSSVPSVPAPDPARRQ